MHRLFHALFCILAGTLLAAVFGFLAAHTIAALTAAWVFNSPQEWWFHYSGAWTEADYHRISLFLILPLSIAGFLSGLVYSTSNNKA